MSTTDVTISPAELEHLLRDDPDTNVFDVRSGSEFETVHIPASINIPLETMSEHAGHFAEHVHPIVLVCQSGARAAQAQAALQTAGRSNVRVLDGGIGSWLAAGGDAKRGDEKWPMDRQVRLVAGSLVLIGFLLSRLAKPFLAISAGVGAGLTYSAVSNTCTMAAVLGKLPYNKGPECDIEAIIAATSPRRPVAAGAA